MEPLGDRPRLVDQVHDAILDAICDGTLLPGTHLRQEELADRLGVSRQPVLQALMLLEREGYVISAGRRGLRVPDLEPELVRHLYEMRSVLDGLAARTSAERAAPEGRAQGKVLVQRGRDAVRSDNLARMIEADMAFHRWLYELSGNPLIDEMAERHWGHIRRVMSMFLRAGNRLDHVWDEHEAIVDAVIAGDAAAAEALARRHAEDSERMVMVAVADRTGATADGSAEV